MKGHRAAESATFVSMHIMLYIDFLHHSLTYNYKKKTFQRCDDGKQFGMGDDVWMLTA